MRSPIFFVSCLLAVWFCVGAIPLAAHGQTVSAALPALTLDQALALALSQHPTLRAARAEVDAAQALVRQASAWPNPELAALLEDQREATRTTTLQINQPIELGGQRAARQEAARWQQQQAASDQAQARAEIEARVHQAYYGLALAQERQRIGRSLHGLAVRAREAADKRVAAGKAPPIEAVRAKVAEVQARASLMQASSGAQAAWQTLAQAMGATLFSLQASWPAGVQFDAALPALSAWQDLDARVAQGPALQRAQSEVARRQALADLERARATPDITFSLGMKHDAQVGRQQALAGVVLSLPIFDRNHGARDAALRLVDKAQAERDALAASLLARAVEVREQLRAALEQWRALREDILPSTQQALDMASRGYEQGRWGFLDMLDAQRIYFEAQTQALAHADAAYRAEARLIELLGGVMRPAQGAR